MKNAIQEKLVGLQGIMVTPFLENGDIDYKGLAKNASKLIAAGVKWLTCTGHCGEFASLTYEEYVNVIKTLCEAVKGTEAIVVPSTNSHSLRSLISLCNEAEKAGAGALLMAPPYYSPCTFAAAKEFFGEISKNCSLPIELYYYPQMHRMNLTLDQLVELLTMECFVAIKETSCDVVTFTQLCARMGKEINIITGAGEYLVPDIMIAGGKGYISTFANFMPEVTLKIWGALEDGDYAKAARMRNALTPLYTALSRYGSLDTIKKLMNVFGYNGGVVRLPELPAITKKEELDLLVGLVIALKEDPLFT